MRDIRTRFSNLPFQESCRYIRASARPCYFRGCGSHRNFIRTQNNCGGSGLPNHSSVYPHHTLTQATNLIHLMADENDCAAAAGNVLHFAEAFFLEGGVADGEDFVDEEDFGFEMRGDGEGQPHAHAAAVMLEGRVDEAFDFGEGDDFVELAPNLGLAHAQDRAAEENVFAAGQLRMKAGADFEQAADAPVEFRAPHGGPRDARQQFEQRGFARSVSADQADDFALLDLEGNVADGPDEVRGRPLAVAAKCAGQNVAKRTVTLALPDAVALADSFDANDGISHCLVWFSV